MRGRIGHDVEYTILLDPEGEARWTYRAFSLPTAILLDAEGLVQATHVGLLSGMGSTRS